MQSLRAPALSQTKESFFASFASTLRGRLIILICLATLPTLLFIFFIADNERARSIQRAKDESRYLANLISVEHLYQISGAKGLLRWLTNKMQQKDAITFARDSEFLASLLSGYPQLSNIAILSADGAVLNSAYPVVGEINMFKYGAIQRAIHSKDIETGTYVVGPIVKRPLLHLAKSIADSSGKARWVVFVAIDLEWLKSLAEEIELPSKQILLIVDRDGTVLAASRKSDSAIYSVGTKIPELAETALKGRTIVSTSAAKRAYSFAVAPMEGVPGILIVTALQVGLINDEANAAFYRMFSLLFLVTLTTVISVIFIEEATLLQWLRALSRASQKFGEGDYSVRVPIQPNSGELKNMSMAFNLMAQTLSNRHQELEEAHNRLERLAQHLQIARESEAQRIARDLHDEVGQVLTSIKMDLARVDNTCDQSCGASLLVDVALIREKIDSLVDLIRRIASDLRPPVLDRMGLVSAVELLCRSVERNSHLVIDVESGGLPEPLDWLITITLYRIVQESLTNIRRHSGASEVRIHFGVTDTEIILTVEDNGVGIKHTDDMKEGLGIIGMQERARLVNGTFALESEPGKGTLVRVTIPYLFNVQ